MVKTRVFSSVEIAKAIGGIHTGKEVKIDKVSIDSREHNEGMSCYFAILGKKYDGRNFINQAIKNGAEIIITNKKIEAPVSVIYVNDTTKALGLLGKYSANGKKVIGITGSVGKTTTKELISSILREKYSIVSTKDNNNNEIGVPLTLLEIKDHDYAIVEMGMRQQGEIRWLSYISRPCISVITNIGNAHLELLGSRENIFKAKTEILENTSYYAVVPFEEKFTQLNLIRPKLVYFGENTEYCIDKYEVEKNGIICSVKCKNKLINSISVKTYSVHNLSNILSAIAVCDICGVEEEDIRTGINKLPQIEKRGEIIKIADLVVINDAYNASFESMKSAIYSLSEYAKVNNKRPVALLGDMLEIGDGAEEYHYRIGELCRDLGLENIFVYGKFSSCYIDGYIGGVRFVDRDKIAKSLISYLANDTVLLVKASNSLKFFDIVKEMKELSYDGD